MTYTPETEYTEGDVDATITGPAIMWEDTGDVLRAVSALKPLPIAGAVTGTFFQATQPVSTAPVTSGGLSIFKDLDVTTTGELIKGSAGQVYSLVLQRVGAGNSFIKLYNKATAPVVGTDIPVATYLVQDKAPVIIDIAAGAAFSLGIGIGASGAIADSDTTAVANVLATVMYK